MASGKRSHQFLGHDKDGEAPCNNSKRRQSDSIPPQFRSGYETEVNEGDKNLMERIFGPMFRRAVRGGVTAVLDRHPHLGTRPRCSRERQKTFELRFNESPKESYTGVKVEAKNGASLEVALYQCDRVVTEGPLSSARIKLCVLEGSFGSNGRDDWSSEDFRRSILKQTRKGGELITGDLSLTLTNGVATINDLSIHDISTWAKTQHFRLGASVVGTTPETENIREAISQPFRVKDCRGIGYQKHGIPSLSDEIWRLEDIGKGGKRHKLLLSKGIHTVEAFLHWLNTNPNQLKQDLQKVGVGENTWKNLIRHATKACAKQNVSQPYLPTAPFDSESNQNFMHAGQRPLQQEPLPPAPQGLSMPSTSTWHFGETVYAGQADEMNCVGGDVDFNFLAEVLNNHSTHEGHRSNESSCPNSGVYISSRGSCITLWGQIRSVFKTTWTWLHLPPAKKKPKLVSCNFKKG